MPEDTTTLLSGDQTTQTTQTATTPASLVGEDLAFAQGWTDKLPEEMGDARSTFGKFKSLTDLAKSYHGLEQKMGKDANAIRLPGKDAKPEEIAAYRKAIGAPDTVDGYLDIKPDNIPEGIEFNADLAKPFYEIAAKHGIPKAAMVEMIQAQVAMEKHRVDAIGDTITEQRKGGEELLKRDWGTNFGANLERAKQAAQLAGLDVNSPGANDPQVVKALLALSLKISDDTWQSAKNNTNSSSMNAKDIMTNPNNPLFKDYQGDNGKERQAAAQAQVTALMQQNR